MWTAADTALWTEMLSTVTEFSIGLAGFSGVAAALMQRRGSVSDFNRFRITANIGISLLPGFVAFLAISLIGAGLEPTEIVWIGSGFLVLFECSKLIQMLFLRNRFGGSDRFTPVSLAIMVIATVINLPLQLYNMIALPSAAFGVFVAGLALVLLTGAANFAGLVWQMLGYETSPTAPGDQYP